MNKQQAKNRKDTDWDDSDAFLFGWMICADDDQASDGAWWAMLEDSVRMYNDEYGTNLDPTDTVHRYIAEKSE